MRTNLKTLSLAALVAAVGLATPSILKAEVGYPSRDFVFATSHNDDFANIYSASNLEAKAWWVGGGIDCADDPVEFGDAAGNRVANVVDLQCSLQLAATYGIFDWWSMGINIPLVAGFDVRDLLLPGDELTAIFAVDDDSEHFGLGDIEIFTKFHLVGEEDSLFNFGVKATAKLPTGEDQEFAGAEQFRPEIKAIFDFAPHERIDLFVNVGAEFLLEDTRILNFDPGHVKLLAAIGLRGVIIEDFLKIGIGGTGAWFINDDDEEEIPIEAFGALEIHPGDHFKVTVGGGAGLTRGVAAPNWRAFLGLSYQFDPPECPACVEPEPDTTVINIAGKVHFAFDSARIRPESYGILNDVAAIMKSNMGKIRNVEVQGHTDAVGSDAYNKRLSQRRSDSVKRYLMNKGIPASMLTPVGYGEDRPVDTNTTAAGRARNRRVEFRVN